MSTFFTLEVIHCNPKTIYRCMFVCLPPPHITPPPPPPMGIHLGDPGVIFGCLGSGGYFWVSGVHSDTGSGGTIVGFIDTKGGLGYFWGIQGYLNGLWEIFLNDNVYLNEVWGNFSEVYCDDYNDNDEIWKPKTPKMVTITRHILKIDWWQVDDNDEYHKNH